MIPESWDEITLEQQSLATDAIRLDTGPHTKLMGIVSALSGMTQRLVKMLHPDKIGEVQSVLAFYFEKQPAPTPVEMFEFEGVTYHVPTDIGQESFGEFVDLDSVIMEFKDQNLWHAIPGMMAVYCRPLGEKYDPDNNLIRAGAFKRLPIKTAEGVAAFFLNRGNISKAITLQYSTLRIHVAKEARTLRSLLKTMVGLQRLLIWPKMILLRLVESRIKISGKLSGFSHL